MTNEPTTPGEAVRVATERVLQAASRHLSVEADAGNGTHARATSYAEFLSALVDYHMAELRVVREELVTQRRGGKTLLANAVAAAATQCRAINGIEGRGLTWCERAKGHHGMHRDVNGKRWPEA